MGGVGAIATKEDAGIVKPADGLLIAEDGTLKVSIDGTTLTMDQVNNVIKLADTLKEKINGAFPAANVVNNQITTETGYALDARQANPNIDGTLAKQLSDLNGSLNNDINALNPSSSIKAYIKCYTGVSGMGWYRFSEIIFENSSLASGALCHCIEVLIMQMYNFAPGCFHKINIYMKIPDSAKITAIGQNVVVLKKVRAVRKDNIIFLDIYSSQISNDTYVLLNIPLGQG